MGAFVYDDIEFECEDDRDFFARLDQYADTNVSTGQRLSHVKVSMPVGLFLAKAMNHLSHPTRNFSLTFYQHEDISDEVEHELSSAYREEIARPQDTITVFVSDSSRPIHVRISLESEWLTVDAIPN